MESYTDHYYLSESVWLDIANNHWFHRLHAAKRYFWYEESTNHVTPTLEQKKRHAICKYKQQQQQQKQQQPQVGYKFSFEAIM